MQKFIFLITLLSFLTSFAQDSSSNDLIPKIGLIQYDPLTTPNTFRNLDNPYYWKNRKPSADYWQQDVHYAIQANIDEKTDIITGEEILTYWNNSPDTLQFVFFHLYQNAFQPGSYYADLTNNNKVQAEYGEYEAQGLGTTIDEILVNNQAVKTELDNTILKVYLPTPLLPDQSIRFEINFKTYFDNGSMRRRMKPFDAYGEQHYNGVHWYPRISVYDRKFGWTTDQHLGKEFYGDFGCFDVELTFANNYVVEATGFLQNRSAVLPDSLRKKLDIKNFVNKPWEEKPSIIIPYDSTKRKTWIYHAENVHDFAFTADPTYRIGEYKILPFTQSSLLDSSRAIALVQEPHAAKWQNAAEYAAKVVRVYSEDIGMYAYNKIIVADAQDGMEYPMITLDGGKDPGYRGLLAHEIGHNWFFGMVGNNETYRAALDEGFTQFLTAWSLIKIDGEEFVRDSSSSSYYEKHKKHQNVLDSRVYYSYLRDAIREQDAFLNTHSDDFGGALRHGGGYRHVYYKTATMLYNLRYVLGDTLFLEAMQHYFDKWKICHPYIEDFKQAIIEYTNTDLNWYFDQWFETTKNIDYAVSSAEKTGETDEGKNFYSIKFERKGDMQMPIDFIVINEEEDTFKYYIPNTWFEKHTTATTLPRWIGWGEKLNPTYEASVCIPGKLKDVVISPDNQLADVYVPNNSLKCNPDVSFDWGLSSTPNRRFYEIQWRPDVWYNAYDGIKAGLHAHGDYMGYKHKFSLSAWYNTSILQGNPTHYELTGDESGYDLFSFNFSYETGIEKISKQSSVYLNLKWLDGLWGGTVGAKKDISHNNTVWLYFKSMYRPDSNSLNYLIYDRQWLPERINNSLNIEWLRTYQYAHGGGSMNWGLRSSSLFSDYNYAYLDLELKNNTNIHKLDLRTRFYGRYGTGNSPLESALFLAGANPEEMMDNKYVRSKGFVPNRESRYDVFIKQFQYGGGLNVRGYAGYTAVDSNETDGVIYEVYRGNSGLALNGELEFDDYFNFKPKALRKYLKLDLYFFGDIGTMLYRKNNNELEFSAIRADAGIGSALTIKKFGILETPNPLTIRFDVPLFLNRPPFADPNFVQFRWVLSVQRAF